MIHELTFDHLNDFLSHCISLVLYSFFAVQTPTPSETRYNHLFCLAVSMELFL